MRRLATFFAATLLVACAHGLDGRWSAGAEPPPPRRLAGQEGCDAPRFLNGPPPADRALTESEAIAYIPQMVDGALCVSPAERARIARDTGALRLYADVVMGRRHIEYTDAFSALGWLESSDDPEPYLPIFLALAAPDTADDARFQYAALGLLRLAPTHAVAREALAAVAEHGGWRQRVTLTEYLVHSSDSTARALLCAHRSALLSTPWMTDRRSRDVERVIASPLPRPGESTPCDSGGRFGRTPSGAYACVAPVPGARVLRRDRDQEVARFDRRGRGRPGGGDQLTVHVSSPSFMGSNAHVGVGVWNEAGRSTMSAGIGADTLLRVLSLPDGSPLTAAQIRDSVIANGGGVSASRLTVRRVERGKAFEVTTASAVVGLDTLATATIRLSPRDTDRFLDVLRRAAALARAEEARGIEETLP